MTESMFYAVWIGGGLVLCGYMLGLSKGHRIGVQTAMAALVEANLVKPSEILRHYSRMGKRDARAMLSELEKRIASEKDRDDAEDKGLPGRREDHTDR